MDSVTSVFYEGWFTNALRKWLIYKFTKVMECLHQKNLPLNRWDTPTVDEIIESYRYTKISVRDSNNKE